MKRTRSDGEERDERSGNAVRLTVEERELIVRACRKYRQSVPAYIASRQDELKNIDTIIEKFSHR